MKIKKLNPVLPKKIEDITTTITILMTGLTKKAGLTQFVPLGDFAQGIIAEGLLSTVKNEIEGLIKLGKAKRDYFSSKQAHYNLAELLKFFDEEIPDESKFEILKNILLVASTEEKTKREDIRPQQYMKIIKSLPSGAILIMTSCYQIHKDGVDPVRGDGTIETDEWRRRLAEKTGLHSYEMVCNFEEILERDRLISSPIGIEKVFVPVTPYFRLTKLGFDIIDYANGLK